MQNIVDYEGILLHLKMRVSPKKTLLEKQPPINEYQNMPQATATVKKAE